MENTVTGKGDDSFRKTVWGHVLNWALMIIMTIIAFLAVGLGLMSPFALIAFILVLAVIQVLLQVILFMHLRVENAWPRVFMFWGGMMGTIFILGIIWMT